MTDVMANEDAAEWLEARGIYATPVLRVDDALLIGYDPARVDRLLGLTPPPTP